MNGRIIDILVSLWVAAVGFLFAILPLAASKNGGQWIIGVWDLWRFPYGIALIVCGATAALRAYRWILAAWRHGE